MLVTYTISNTISDNGEKLWYAHKIGFPNIPAMIEGCKTFGSKVNALHNAAIMMCLPYKEYMALRQESARKINISGVDNYVPKNRK